MTAEASCIFCKIAEGKIPAAKVYEDETVFCIRDLYPQAKTHLLVIPKAHYAQLDLAYAELGDQKASELVGALFRAGLIVARQEGLLPGGFRSVINTGVHGGQSVFHIHLHLLGGQSLEGRFA